MAESEYYSAGWWKDEEGNIRQGSVESRGFKQAKEKGKLGTEPKSEPAADDTKTAEDLAAAEAKAAEEAAATKAAEAKAAEEAAAAAAAGQNRRRN